jgi:hypothetical protein
MRLGDRVPIDEPIEADPIRTDELEHVVGVVVTGSIEDLRRRPVAVRLVRLVGSVGDRRVIE